MIWMNISAVIGLSTKFAESMLSVKYRVKNESGNYVGGPMYTLKNAFPYKKAGSVLGSLFALFAVFASFGMGNMVQANSISQALYDSFRIPVADSGVAITVLAILTVLGGIKSISRLTLYMVPFMAIMYILGTVTVIVINIEHLPKGLCEMFTMAFSLKSVAGGIGGSVVASISESVRWGVSRGVFSNEAGLGASGISAAAADTDDPVRQGYISMTGVFFDTTLICTLTGLALCASGVVGMTDIKGNVITGTALTIATFSTAFGKWGGSLVSIAIALFAFATIIAWEYEGEKAFEFLVQKRKYCIIYRFVYTLLTFVGSVCALELVWNFSDIMNALMAVPNLICIIILSKVVCRDIKKYSFDSEK